MLLNIANTRSKTAYAVQTFLYLTKGHFYPIEIPDYTIPNGNKKQINTQQAKPLLAILCPTQLMV